MILRVYFTTLILVSLFTVFTASLAFSQSLAANQLSGTIVACAGTPGISPNLGKITVSGFDLTSPLDVAASSGFEVSTDQGTGFGSLINLNPVAGTVPNTIIYIRLQSQPAGALTGTITLTSAGASAKIIPISGTVNSLPILNAINNITLNGDEVFPGVAFSSSTTGTNTYPWTNSNAAIGIPASGSGNINSFTAVNSGVTPITSTVTVTPVSTSFAYIPNGSNQVKVINALTREVVATVATGSNPMSVTTRPDGLEVYVSNHNANTVSVISTVSNTVIKTINTGQAPLGVAVAGDKLYIANRNGNLVSVFSTATHTLIKVITVNSFPNSIAASPAGDKVYVSHSSGTVSVISTATNSVLATINIPSTFGMDSSPEGLVVSADGSKLYVANNGMFENNVAVVNTLTNSVVNTIPVGEYPFAVALSASGERVYVTNSNSNTVSVISTETGTVINTIPVGAFPQGISSTSDGQYIYVVNKQDGNVSVISEETSSVIGQVSVGSLPTSEGKFITQGTGCAGSPVNFTITINPANPKLTTSTASGSITACYGTASAKPKLQSFTLSGIYLNDNVSVTAPTGFEVSLSDDSGFSSDLSITPTNRALATTTIYVRSSATALTGSRSGNVTISTTGATSKLVAVNATIYILPTVSSISDKLFTDSTFTEAVPFTGTGTTYNWTNNNTLIGLAASGSGAQLPSFKASNGIGEDTLRAIINVVPVSTQGCQGLSQSFNVTIRPYPPVIESTFPEGVIHGCVGEASADLNLITFKISGIKLKEGILVTAPDNFEVSQSSNSNYGQTTLVNLVSRKVDDVKIYVRSTASSPVGDHNGVVTLSSLDATTISVPVKAEVHALPVLNTLENLSFLTGETTSKIQFSGDQGSLDYLWSIDNDQIGLSPSGRGIIEPFQAINPGVDAITATVTVQPKSTLFAAIPNRFSDNLSIINAEAFKAEAMIGAGDFPQGVVFSPDGKKIYTINFTSKDVSVFSTESRLEIGRIALPGNPSGIAINHKGDRLYIYNSSTHQTSIIDTSTETILKSASGGSYAMVVSPDDQYLYYSNYSSSNGVINKLDANTLQVISFKIMGNYNSHGVALDITPDGQYIYATSCKPVSGGAYSTEDLIYVIETSTMTGSPRINVWQSSTMELHMSDDGSHVYIMNIRGEFYKISTHTNSIVDTIKTGGSATEFEIKGNFAYLINSGYNASDPNAPNGHLRIIDLAAEELVSKVYTGQSPTGYGGAFLSKPTGCVGAQQSFTITIYPDNHPLPVVQVSDLSGDLIECNLTGEVQQFSVSAENVSNDVAITAPEHFEISTTSNANFSKTITLNHVGGTVAKTTIYFRLPSNARHGMIREEVTISSTGVNSKKLVITGFNNSLPELTGINVTDGTFNTPYSHSITGYDGLTFTASGLPAGLSITSAGKIQGTPTQANENLSPFTVTISNATCSKSATFYIRINKKSASVSVNYTPLTYNGTGRTASVLVSPSGIGLTVTYNGSTTLPVNVGTYSVVATVNDPNYKGGPSSGSLVISKASVVARADNFSRQYGQANPTFTITYTGLQNNEPITVIDTPPSIGTSATVESNVGTYAITLTGGTDNNYNITRQNGTLTINPMTAAVSINNTTFTYNGTGRGASISTTPAGKSVAVTYNGSSTLPVNAGSYSVVATVNDPNYTGNSTATLVISKAEVMATANNLTRSYSQENPPLTITYTGLQNNESASVIDSPPLANTSATTASNVGIYPITLTGGTDSNYNITRQDGFLTINQLEAEVLISGTELTYDGNERTVNISTEPSGLDVMVTYNGSSALPVDAGTYSVSAMINNINCKGSASRTMVIQKAEIIARAENQIRLYKQENPPMTIVYSGFQNNESPDVLDVLPLISTSATSASDAGIYRINLTGGSDNNYRIMLQDGSLTISPIAQSLSFENIPDKNSNDAPFTLSAAPSSGLPVTYNMISGPATVFGNRITLTGEAGEVTVAAIQAGNINYLPVSEQRTFVVHLITALPEEINKLISVYPNPTSSGMLHVTLPDGGTTASISIIDLLGNIVLDVTSHHAKDNVTTLDINHLTSGVYLVRTVYQGKRQDFKIVKQ